ncbi:MAG TPA: hypothetical protein V6C76_07040 [Drouetiella sp.]
MSSLKDEIEADISGANTYELAEHVSDKIMGHTMPPVQPDKLWHKWERSLLSALVLHCALNPDERTRLEKLHQFLLSPEFGRDEVLNTLTTPEEKAAVAKFESSLALSPTKPDAPVTKLILNRWSGTISGLANRINKLRFETT